MNDVRNNWNEFDNFLMKNKEKICASAIPWVKLNRGLINTIGLFKENELYHWNYMCKIRLHASDSAYGTLSSSRKLNAVETHVDAFISLSKFCNNFIVHSENSGINAFLLKDKKHALLFSFHILETKDEHLLRDILKDKAHKNQTPDGAPIFNFAYSLSHNNDQGSVVLLNLNNLLIPHQCLNLKAVDILLLYVDKSGPDVKYTYLIVNTKVVDRNNLSLPPFEITKLQLDSMFSEAEGEITNKNDKNPEHPSKATLSDVEQGLGAIGISEGVCPILDQEEHTDKPQSRLNGAKATELPKSRSSSASCSL